MSVQTHTVFKSSVPSQVPKQVGISVRYNKCVKLRTSKIEDSTTQTGIRFQERLILAWLYQWPYQTFKHMPIIWCE